MAIALWIAGLLIGAAVAGEALRSACAVFNALFARGEPIAEPEYHRAVLLAAPAILLSAAGCFALRFLVFAPPTGWLPVNGEGLWCYPAAIVGVFLPGLTGTLRFGLPATFRRAAGVSLVFLGILTLAMLVLGSIAVAVAMLLSQR